MTAQRVASYRGKQWSHRRHTRLATTLNGGDSSPLHHDAYAAVYVAGSATYAATYATSSAATRQGESTLDRRSMLVRRITSTRQGKPEEELRQP